MKSQNGFTLIELVVTLAVAMIILTVGVPSFTTILRNAALTATANDLVGALNLARSEAVKRRVPTRLCKSNDGVSCATSADWEAGWLVFADDDRNGVPATAEIIRVYPALANGYTLRANGNFGHWVEFQPTGATLGSSGNSDTFRLCHGAGVDFSRSVDVAPSGRVQVAGPATVCP